MKKVYACLIGQWVCLNDDPDCVLGPNQVSPSIWLEESSIVHAPKTRNKYDSYDDLDYINISYKGKDYRINPMFIQVVTS